MTLYEYKLEHLGKVLYRTPTINDWHWCHKEYGAQYYIGNEKPKQAFSYNSHNDFCDTEMFRYKQIDLINFNPTKEKISYYFIPAPIYPKWISDACHWRMKHEYTNSTSKTTLLELEKLIVSHKKYPTVNTTYYKCMISTPHDNKTHIEWVLQKWIEPIKANLSLEELKAQLLKEHRKEKNIR